MTITLNQCLFDVLCPVGSSCFSTCLKGNGGVLQYRLRDFLLMNVWLVLQEKYLTACANSENSDHTARNAKPGPEVIKLFSCSTQMSMKFFLLINVKMPTIVGILTFMNGKNSILGLSEPKKSRIS